MPTVKTSDGRTLVFPDGMSKDEMAAALGKLPPLAGAAPDDSAAPDRVMGGAVVDAWRGAGKRLIETGYNVGKGVVNVAKNRPADTPINPDFEAALKPQNTAEKVGQVGADIGTFAATDGALGTATKVGAIAKLPKILQLGIDAVKGAAVGAGVTKAQGGSDGSAAANAVVGGIAPLALAGIAEVSPRIGNKILNTLIRPTQRDTQAGFDVANIAKYDLGGTLDQMATKTHQAIEQRAAQLHDALQTANASGATVDALGALADAEAQVKATAGKTFGKNKRIAAVVKDFTDELNEIAPNGQIDLVKAQEIKRGVGNLGAWTNGHADLDGQATEAVANAFYSKLKTAIEKAAPNANVAEINRQLGELIPIETAVIRRIPVEARMNIPSLGDIIALSSGNGGMVAAKAALRSGAVGSTLQKGVTGGVGAVRAATQATVSNAGQ